MGVVFGDPHFFVHLRRGEHRSLNESRPAGPQILDGLHRHGSILIPLLSLIPVLSLAPWVDSTEGQFECIPDEFDSMTGGQQFHRHNIKPRWAAAQMAFRKII